MRASGEREMSNSLDREKQGVEWQGAAGRAQFRIANFEFNELNNSRTQ